MIDALGIFTIFVSMIFVSLIWIFLYFLEDFSGVIAGSAAATAVVFMLRKIILGYSGMLAGGGS